MPITIEHADSLWITQIFLALLNANSLKLYYPRVSLVNLPHQRCQAGPCLFLSRAVFTSLSGNRSALLLNPKILQVELLWIEALSDLMTTVIILMALEPSSVDLPRVHLKVRVNRSVDTSREVMKGYKFYIKRHRILNMEPQQKNKNFFGKVPRDHCY